MTDVKDIISGYVLALIFLVTGSYVLVALWGWFIVPIFDLPVLSIPQAAGIRVVGGFFTTQYNADIEEKDMAWKIVYVSLTQFLYLSIGYCVAFYMGIV